MSRCYNKLKINLKGDLEIMNFVAKLGKGIKEITKSAKAHVKSEVKRGFSGIGGAVKRAAKYVLGDMIISFGIMMIIDFLDEHVYEPIKKKIRDICEVLDEDPADYIAEF